ncbi:hypothetical protein JST97_29465 [bacterium]|nr:hypothetical protein [bacterium]
MDKLLFFTWLLLAFGGAFYFMQPAPESETKTPVSFGPPPALEGGPSNGSVGTLLQTKVWTTDELDKFVLTHRNEIEFVSSDYLRWRNWTAEKMSGGKWLCSEYRNQ